MVAVLKVAAGAFPPRFANSPVDAAVVVALVLPPADVAFGVVKSVVPPIHKHESEEATHFNGYISYVCITAFTCTHIYQNYLDTYIPHKIYILNITISTNMQ